MKHIEPNPHVQDSAGLSQKKVRQKTNSIFIFSLVLALFVGSLGYGLSQFESGIVQDIVTSQEAEMLEQNFAKLESVKLVPVAKHEVAQAIASMELSSAEVNQLKTDLQKNTSIDPSFSQQAVTLVWLQLWDSVAQDGDVVHVATAGYEIDVPLLHAKTKIAVPIDATQKITLSGVADGGGGITLGIQTPSGLVSLPVLLPGTSLDIPVSL